MSYCSIDEAFADPFIKTKKNKKRKNKHNNEVIENFECLDGSNQLNISDEYQYKGDLSKQQESRVINANLNNTTELMHQDEKTFYPNMSLESEYALLTDVHTNKNQGYRPANPFTKSSNPESDMMINDGMFESFNQSDNIMALEHDTLRNNLLSPQEVVKNEMIYQNNQETPKSKKQVINIDKMEHLLNSYKKLEMKLDSIINKLDKIDDESSESKENIHDIILFAIFGIFFIYILDSVYRIGKKTI
jgi:hypothetical protein